MLYHKASLLAVIFLAATLSVNIQASNIVFNDDFETEQGWVVNPSSTDTATIGLWERSDPLAVSVSGPKQLDNTVSGTHGLFTGPQTSGAGYGAYDIDGGVTSIRSPNITLPTLASGRSLELTFSFYFSHYHNQSSSDDYLKITVIGDNSSTVVHEDRGLNMDRDAIWASRRLMLDSYAGQTINILIEAADEASGSLVDAGIDDVVIKEIDTPEIIFSDDFESDQGWVVNYSATDTATQGLWERGDPEPTQNYGVKQLGYTVSGTSALVTKLSTSSTDVDGGITSIRSPNITLPVLSAGESLESRFYGYLAHTSGATSDDYLRVSVVGTSGTTVLYETVGVSVVRDGVWHEQISSLNTHAGEQVYLLIEAADNASDSLIEAAIDDVQIVKIGSSGGGGNTAPTVTITSPTILTYLEGEQINFVGSANDTEDGDITSGLQWTSDQDGLIGTTGAFNVSNLSVGTHVITASVTDSGNVQATATINIDITQPANTAPVVTITGPADGSSYTEEDTITFTATATDAEDDDASLIVQWNSSINNAIGTGTSLPLDTLSLGTHTITASVTDSNTVTDTDTITVTVTEVPNTAPVANDDARTTTENTPITFDPRGNDTDDDGDPLTITGVTQGANGNVTFTNADVTYTPNTDFTGTDNFTYTIDDGNNGSDIASVTMTVTASGGGGGGSTVIFTDDFETDQGWVVNPDTTDTATTGMWERANPEETTHSGVKQLGTTVSGDNGLVTQALAGGGIGTYDIDGGLTSIRSPDIVLPSLSVGENLEMSLYYSFAHTNNSSVDDEFRITLVGNSNTVLYEILGSATNRNGSWEELTANLNGYAGQTVYLLIEASDNPAGSIVEAQVDDVQIIKVGSGGGNTAPTVTITSPTILTYLEGEQINFVGSANDTEDGDITSGLQWTSDQDGLIGTTGAFNVSNLSVGTHVITASVTDSGNVQATATINIDITQPANTAPVVTITGPADGSSYTEEDTITFTATATDAEDDDASLIVQWNSSINNAIGTGTSLPLDTLSLGTHTITASVTDSNTVTDTDTITVTVTEVPNTAPVANDDARTTTENTPITFDPRGNDTDDDGDPLTITGVTQGANGNVTFTNADVTYTPNTDFTGTDNFTYTIDDGNNGSDIASVTMTVTASGGGGGGSTVIFTDDFETDQGWVVNPDTTDTATTGMWERANPEETTHSGVKQLGTTVSGDNGLVTQALAGGGIGTYDIDGGLTSIRSPDIVLPSLSVGENLEMSLYYSFAHTNNSSVDDEFRITLVGNSNTVLYEILGSATNRNGSWEELTANLNGYAGQTVYLLIEASDNPAGSIVEAQVDDVQIIKVGSGGGNTAPTVTITSPTILTYLEGEQINFVGSANDTEDGDITSGLQWTSDQDGLIGTTGAFNVSNLSVGTHVITASVTDSGNVQATATINIDITQPANTAPVVTITGPADGSSYTEEDTITFTATATDAEDDDASLIVQWNSSINNAIGTGTSLPLDTLSLGTHTITASVTDSNTVTDTDTITVTVTEVPNTAPVANDDARTTTENTPITFDPRGNDTDDDGDPLTITGVTQGANGNVTFTNADVTYTPNIDFTGTDNFTYTIDDGNNGSDTANVTITVNTSPQPPTVPGNPSGDISSTDGTATINWTAASGDVTAYELQRNDNGAGWNPLDSVTGLTYPDSGLTNGSYSYRVRACNGTLCSAYTATHSVTVSIGPAGLAVQHFQYDALGRLKVFSSDNNAYLDYQYDDAGNRELVRDDESILDPDEDGLINSIDTDDDNDLMTDVCELENGFNQYWPGDADKDEDGDGVSNVDECLAMTDPLDENSF